MRFTRFGKQAASICGLALVISGWCCAAPGTEPAPTAVATPRAVSLPRRAPAFKLKDLAGKEVQLSDFVGKALIVVFWGTFSRPCEEQLKVLNELQQQYAEKPFAVVGINIDDKGAKPVQAFAEKNKLNFPILVADYQVIQDFGGLTSIPTLFVIETNHNIIQRYEGVTEKAKLENDLKPALER